MKTVVLVSVLAVQFLATIAHAEYSISILLNPQYQSYVSDTLFNVPDTYIRKPNLTSMQTIELTGGFQQPSTTYQYLLSAVNTLSDDKSPDTAFNVNELFLSHSIDNWELTLGRRINSWGVGYGFRPLDVVQQYDRQTTSQQSMIGKNQFSLEYFSDTSSWSLLWVNPFPDEEINNQQRESFVAKYSTSRESHDLHTLLRYNDENKFQFGLGGIKIVSNAIAIHGSLLFSQQHQKKLHILAGQSDILLSPNYPYASQKYNNGLQALIGLNWSSISKHNVIIEYWYDDMAYSRQQWKKHFQLAKQQQAMLEQSQIPEALIYSNIAWTASAIQARSLAQHNIMLRWNYDADYWKPTINILLSPDDNSFMSTLSITRAYNVFKLEAGLRMFTGTNDSVYGGLIVNYMTFVTLLSEY